MQTFALEFNAFRSPQILDQAGLCDSRGPTCEVQLDVPEACLNPDATSDCPIIIFLHDELVTHESFKFTSGVHKQRMIGVYPRSDCTGWNTKPLSCNLCSVENFNCETDPNEPLFFIKIIRELRVLDAKGNIYLSGNTNGGSLAHKLAVNAGPDLPISGIMTTAMQLLQSPIQSGPGPFNYNQPIPGNPPVSVLSIHGTDDRLIPYFGGFSIYFEDNNAFSLMSNSDSNLAWAAHNGCNLIPTKRSISSTLGSLANVYEYENCVEGVTVKHYEIVNGGHFAVAGKVDDTSLDDLAYSFVRVNEGGGGTLMPTISPAPTAPFSCTNDPTWFFWNRTFDCDFVGESPNTRCVLLGRDGRPAKRACPIYCDDRCLLSSTTLRQILLYFSRLGVSKFIDFLRNVLSLGNPRLFGFFGA